MKYGVGYWHIWKPIYKFKMSYFNIGLGLPSLALIIVPIIYILMVRYSQKSPNDILRMIIPHLVCIVWMDVAVTMWLIGYQYFTISGIILTGSLISLFIFPSYIGVVLAMGVVFSQIKASINLVNSFRSCITIINYKF